MDPSFIPVEVVPSKAPFGLDQLRRSYKTALSAEDAIAAAPAVGDADEVFPCMFLMPISTPESAESATRIDLLYMGTIAFTGTGAEGDPFLPVLPASKQSFGLAVQTASNQIPMAGAAASSPLTLQFYAQISSLVSFSFLVPGVIGAAADPPGDPIIISIQSNDVAYSPGSAGLATIIPNFFQIRATDTIQSDEIVPGHYWQNTEVVSIFYGAPVFVVQVFGGTKAIGLYRAGSGYSVSDSLSVSGGGGSAGMTVTAVDARGAITDFTVGSDTISSTTFLILDASGGTGTGAQFACVNI